MEFKMKAFYKQIHLEIAGKKPFRKTQVPSFKLIAAKALLKVNPLEFT